MTSEFKGRREDYRLVTGQGRYASDWNLPGQVHGAFLRADRAHADIVSIDTARAKKAPGVVAVLTGADLASEKLGVPPPHVKFPGRGGMALKVPHRDLLARDRVRFVGQEVALVLAEAPAAARDAADLIDVAYRDLPVVTVGEAALAAGAPQLHAEIPGNLCFDYQYGDEARTAEAFARAAHVARVTLTAQRMVGNPMEPRACLAAWDAAAERYDLWSCSQGMSHILSGLSGIFGLPEARFRAHARDVGGGFGIRTDAYVEYAAALVAARRLGRPVKWVSSRSETFLSDYQGRDVLLEGALALDGAGRFIGLRVNWLCNMGAYLSQPGPIINTLPATTHMVNAYRIPVLHGRHRLAFTNTAPTTAYRGAFRPNVSYLLESLAEQAARETGIDRVALRRRNVIPREAFPHQTPTVVYDSGDPPGLLDLAVEQSSWKTFDGRRDASKREGRLRGIGCAVFIEPSGGGTAPREEVAIKFGDSGNASIYTLAGPSGQGHETVFPDIVAEVLGLSAEKLVLHASDPAGPALVGGGTISSRSSISHGSAMVFAAREVIRKALDLAAKDLEVAPADLEFVAGEFRVKGTDLRVAMETLARRHASALDSMGEIPTPRSYAGGAHVAEVEIDPETGAIELLRYVAADDCGRVLNHTLLDGQLHGGIVQGAGQALGEHCRYDPATGQLLTGSFMDYYMPRAGLLRDVRLFDHCVPAPGNPLGVKGAGEAGTTGAVPAIANAVLDALAPLKIRQLEFPYTPARVWEAIRAARRNQD
ncbi:MAG: xanthine dehydrogenase family protein molybdopterin-binding subunit [Burkholderiales bacterium]|nr:xanthine dehydrogenase family protein molybdopterin-binding subunit [Burkholderiales bacterium]